jgi:predicted dehydrogenase
VINDCGISLTSSLDTVALMRTGYRTGDMWSPHLALDEALHVAARHFVDVIAGSAAPISDGHAGLRIVRLLEAATESMATQARPVAVGTGATV